MAQEPSVVFPAGGLSGWLVRRALPPGADPKSADTRTRLGMLEGWTSAAISVVFSSTKILFGVITGSIAVLADGINNLADVGSSLVIALSFRWSQKPRDSHHPFGHGRVETVAALVLSIALVMVGVDVALESVQRLIKPRPVDAHGYVVAILALTIVVKQWLALFARRLALITNAPVLRADFWNHQFDVLSTSVVVLALFTVRAGWPAVDGWAGLFVSFFILYTGVRYARESIHTLVGEAPTDEEIREIQQTGLAQPGVHGVHDIVVHKYGDHRMVSLHIEVDAARSALEVHDIAERVEAEVGKAASCRATVHVDPVDRDHPMYGKAVGVLTRLVREDRRLRGFHDLRVSGRRKSVTIRVDVVVDVELAESLYGEVASEVKGRLGSELAGMKSVEVGVGAGYSDKG